MAEELTNNSEGAARVAGSTPDAPSGQPVTSEAVPRDFSKPELTPVSVNSYNISTSDPPQLSANFSSKESGSESPDTVSKLSKIDTTTESEYPLADAYHFSGRNNVSSEDHLSGSNVSAEYHLSGSNVSAEYHLSGSNVSAEYHLSGSNVSAEYHLSGSDVSAEYHLSGSNVSAEYPLSGSNVSAEYPLSRSNVSAEYHLSGGNVPTEHLMSPEDVANESYTLSGTFAFDDFRNSTPNSLWLNDINSMFNSSWLNDRNSTSNPSWLNDNNSTFLFNSSLTSGEPTFNFDLTSWLTPQITSENDLSESDGGDIEDQFMILKIIALAFTAVVGCFGNVLVIWSVVKERHLHRPPFYFLLSLGVTDLSRAVFCVPVVITTVLHGSSWRHGESACKLFAFATSFFVFSSALSLLAIAIDRHISIVYSKTYRRRAPGFANLVVAIVIWVIAFSVSFPPVVGVGDYVFIPDEAQCAYQHKHYKHNDSVSSALVFVAILFLTYFLYFRIFRFLRAHRRMRPLQHTPAMSSNWAFVGPGANGQAFINWLNGFGGQVPARHGGQRAVQRLNFGRVVNLSSAKNEHLTRLFLVVTLAFGITWLPYIILSLWRIFFDSSCVPSSFVTVSAWMGYGQLAVCPLIYFLARGPVRKPLRTTYTHDERKEFLLENKVGK